MSMPAGFCPVCGYRINPGVCPECGESIARVLNHNPIVRRRRRRRLTLGLSLLAMVVALGWFRAPIGHAVGVYLWPGWHLRALVDSRGAWQRWAWEALTDRTKVLIERERSHWDARAAVIEANANSSSDEWAGMYRGLAFGSVTLVWSPNEGILVRASDCSGEWFDRAALIDNTPDRIQFTGVVGSQLGHDAAYSFVKVRWGEQRFLIPEHEMCDFCVQYWKDPEIAWPLQERTRGLALAPLPHVPSGYAPQLARAPRTAAIVSCYSYDIVDFEIDEAEADRPWCRPGNYRWCVELDIGRNACILPGKTITALFGDGYEHFVRFATDTTCSLTYCDQMFEQFDSEMPVEPRVGGLFALGDGCELQSGVEEPFDELPDVVLP